VTLYDLLLFFHVFGAFALVAGTTAMAPFALGIIGSVWWWFRRVRCILTSSEPTTLNGGAAPVAVRAADLALIQLVGEALRTAGASHE